MNKIKALLKKIYNIRYRLFIIFVFVFIFVWALNIWPVSNNEIYNFRFYEPVFGLKSESDKININTATAAELSVLEGIGESKAKAIVLYRQENGEFTSIEQIKNVYGIGDKIFEEIMDKIEV